MPGNFTRGARRRLNNTHFDALFTNFIYDSSMFYICVHVIHDKVLQTRVCKCKSTTIFSNNKRKKTKFVLKMRLQKLFSLRKRLQKRMPYCQQQRCPVEKANSIINYLYFIKSLKNLSKSSSSPFIRSPPIIFISLSTR